MFAAQQALYHRARCKSAARLGQYRTEMENNMDSRKISKGRYLIGSDLVRMKLPAASGGELDP